MTLRPLLILTALPSPSSRLRPNAMPTLTDIAGTVISSGTP